MTNLLFRGLSVEKKENYLRELLKENECFDDNEYATSDDEDWVPTSNTNDIEPEEVSDNDFCGK